MQAVIGIPTCFQQTDGVDRHSAPDRYCRALIEISGAIPVLVPAIGPAALAVLTRLDGLLLPGSPSNVWPGLYGEEGSLTPNRHDAARDSTTLPLIRKAIESKIPVLAICRGLQELNVALGGSLHQQLHQVEGRIDHRAGEGSLEQKFATKHGLDVQGTLRSILGEDRLQVNSLHEQGINRIAPGLSAQGWAEDGTVEALWGGDKGTFTLGVQFHPEWKPQENPLGRNIFLAFREACVRRMVSK